MEKELTQKQENEIQRQFDILVSNTTSVVEKAELKNKIKISVVNNKPLNVKLGLDPSAPDIHLGHLVVLKKLKQFQDLGHKVHLVIGDFTGMIGDPTGKSKARVQLTKEEVKTNAKTYIEQFGRILDMNQVEVHYNSTWLTKLNIYELINLLSTTTVARMLERNDFTQRFDSHTPIYLHEFLYPLFQGYDSVALKADIELGGNDQQYNLLVGRKLQEYFGQSKQVVMTMPLLVGLDGKNKMSKSKNNYIGISENPSIIFGKVMSLPDEQMIAYYKLVSSFDDKEVSNFKDQLDENQINPKDLKEQLAKNIIEQVYDLGAANKAQKEFERIFSEKKVPERIEEFVWSGDISVSPQNLFTKTGLLSSKSAVTRMLDNGGLRINSQKLTNKNDVIYLKNGMIIQVGKRRFLKIVINRD
ncbi:tyrosine--tRNA ligase [Companilactobacillus paralimentarius]|uniref:tyrosine--tRNA ligase n=1 Tax=Companilactobacillus paralimentarius TaxID=83526 RepID=UPI00384EA0DF